MGSFAADHVIADPAGVPATAVRIAVAAARDDWLVTIGIEPTFPSLGVRLHPPGRRAARARRARTPCDEFVEKPSVGGRRGLPRHRRATGGTPACSWSAPACCSTCSRAGDPDFAAALREHRRRPDAARRAVAGAAEDRARPRGRRAGRRRRPGGDRARRLRLGRHRRLRLARRDCSATPRSATVLGDAEPGARRRQRPASSCRRPAGSSPWSASTTWSSSTPRTRCWSTTRARGQDVKAGRRRAQGRRAATS